MDTRKQRSQKREKKKKKEQVIRGKGKPLQENKRHPSIPVEHCILEFTGSGGGGGKQKRKKRGEMMRATSNTTVLVADRVLSWPPVSSSPSSTSRPIGFFIRPSFPKKEEAPAFHMAQEAVRPTVYFDTNRLRGPVMNDECLEIKPSIDRSLATPHKLLTRQLADTNEAGLHCAFCSSGGAVGDAMMTSTLGE